jgi:hypothetical protein
VFGSAILDVAIGMIFVYVLVSMICSAVREGIEAWLKTRAAYLERGIRELLHDPRGKALARAMYEHPLIYSLYAGKYKPPAKPDVKPGLLARGVGLPSYIPARNFATALMDIAARGPNPALASDNRAPVLNLETIRANVINIESEPVQRVLLTAIDSAQGSLEQARLNLQDWYDSGMDRVSGWYKRSTQWVLFGVGLTAAVVLNINSITIVDFLYRDDTARAAIVAQAQAASEDTSFTTGGYQVAKRELDALRLPIGWSRAWGAPRPVTGLDPVTGRPREWDPWNGLAGPILGWLVTALAATMGAPFWFDLLNKVMVIRSTVKPKEKSPEEGSEDQPKVPRAPLPAPEPPLPLASCCAGVAGAPEVPMPAGRGDGCQRGGAAPRPRRSWRWRRTRATSISRDDGRRPAGGRRLPEMAHSPRGCRRCCGRPG